MENRQNPAWVELQQKYGLLSREWEGAGAPGSHREVIKKLMVPLWSKRETLIRGMHRYPKSGPHGSTEQPYMYIIHIMKSYFTESSQSCFSPQQYGMPIYCQHIYGLLLTLFPWILSSLCYRWSMQYLSYGSHPCFRSVLKYEFYGQAPLLNIRYPDAVPFWTQFPLSTPMCPLMKTWYLNRCLGSWMYFLINKPGV